MDIRRRARTRPQVRLIHRLTNKEVKMRVLVACEFSGIVRDAFRKRGHEAWSVDLLPSESPGRWPRIGTPLPFRNLLLPIARTAAPALMEAAE